jgi:hypothetical protein
MTIRPVQSVASKFGFAGVQISTAGKCHVPPLGRVRRRSFRRTLPIPPQAYRDGPDSERFRFAHAKPRPARLRTEVSA